MYLQVHLSSITSINSQNVKMTRSISLDCVSLVLMKDIYKNFEDHLLLTLTIQLLREQILSDIYSIWCTPTAVLKKENSFIEISCGAWIILKICTAFPINTTMIIPLMIAKIQINSF